MKAQKALLFSIFSGLLFVFAWPVNGFSIFIFGSFVPLFFVEHSFAQSKKKYAHWRFFGWSYLVFLIWNLGTTWWLINATVFGMLFANLCNSLFFALLFQAFHWSKKRLPLRSAYLFLITLWLAFEKFHLSWDFSWPWLNLGHVFSESIYWIQWYEYTGAFGGSLWVLLVNIFLFEKLNNWTVDQGQTALVKKLIPILIVIALPISLSLLLFQKELIPSGSVSVLVTQPNIDPYEEKYQFTNEEFLKQLNILMEPYNQSQLDYVLTPETYFAAGNGERLKNFERSVFFQKIQENQSQYPSTQLITGIQFFNAYSTATPPTRSANKIREGLWVDFYNSAIAVTPKEPIEIYHKSKLVVGVETMPYKSTIEPLLGNLLLDMGGTMSSRATQAYRSVFTHPKKGTITAPIICYESIYGAFVTEYVQKGAQFLSIITNDAWWGNTPGHKQLLSLARLRAIENRRAIARSANTGISTFISPKGELLEQLPYNKKGALVAKVPLHEGLTFYTIYGDFIARWAGFISVLYFLLALSGRLKNKV
ncbi:MAG: Apolipoprotein N-acyltransferase [Flavobacteriaceae bacterium]|nr:MAG: Apolipoprotein N-acyltransferase [Flavobacteriaceae bacterium]